ncbi:MAG: hypothetical protein Fur002_16910 [Anaerolineales bacterium]
MNDNEEEDALPESFPCEQCHAGMLQPRSVAYFTWLGKELITVPNFPAWVCDVCGRREYDEKAIQWLNMLLNPEAGKPTKSKRAAPPFPRPHSSAPHTRLDS